MVIEFKTLAKLAGVAVGAVAAMVVADKIIDKIYNEDHIEDAAANTPETTETKISKKTAKFVMRTTIAFTAIAIVADRAIRIGLEFGAAAGAGIATRGNMTTDQLLAIVGDRKAFHSFMNDIWKVVRV